MESSASQPPGRTSTIPSPLQSVGLVAAAVLVLMLGSDLFRMTVAALFFTAEQQAQMTDPEVSLFAHAPGWILLGMAIPHVILGAALLALVVRLRMPRDQVLPLKVPGLWSLVGALMVVLGVTPLADVVYVMIDQLGEPTEAPVILTRVVTGAGPLQLVAVIVAFAIIPAVVEESLFRGLVAAAHRRSFWAALLAPAVLFGLIHGGPAIAAAMTILGIAFGLARLFTGSLFTAMFAHAAYNTLVIVVAHTNPESLNTESSAAAVIGGVLLAGAGVLLLPMGRVPAPRGDDPRLAASDDP